MVMVFDSLIVFKDTDCATRLFIGPWMRGDQGEDVDFTSELLGKNLYVLKEYT